MTQERIDEILQRVSDVKKKFIHFYIALGFTIASFILVLFTSIFYGFFVPCSLVLMFFMARALRSNRIDSSDDDEFIVTQLHKRGNSPEQILQKYKSFYEGRRKANDWYENLSEEDKQMLSIYVNNQQFDAYSKLRKLL